MDFSQDMSSSALSMPLSVPNCNSDNISGVSNSMQVKRISLPNDTMFSNHSALSPSKMGESCNNVKSKINSSTLNLPPLANGTATVVTLSEMLPQNGKISVDALNPGSEEDEVLSVGDPSNEVIAEQLLAVDPSSGLSFPASVEISAVDDVKMLAKAIILDKSSIGKALGSDACVTQGGNIVKASAVVLHIPKDKILEGSARSVFGFDCVPLWGAVSVIGMRPEMEDAVAAVPRLLKIPIKMLSNDQVNGVSVTNEKLTHRTAHFYGVYDGHGGCQVANYCKDRIHLALLEEIKMIEDSAADDKSNVSPQEQWEKAFTGCFQKVDEEVGGNSALEDGTADASSEPVAPETVGSTAVVALVCSSHIIVANCGDSRAVLFRSREAKALSIDHKPEREDEHARIEASGGKVIRWNGYRVLGVLAMSRSIGDRYLKPWIIPKPEIKFIPRAKEDECLSVASDGLWDVMSNEEACEVARKRILMWHRKNGPSAIGERGKGIDPAAQAAAEYLSMLAIQRGSKDNISVIVVDLKSQRKFKSRS